MTRILTLQIFTAALNLYFADKRASPEWLTKTIIRSIAHTEGLIKERLKVKTPLSEGDVFNLNMSVLRIANHIVENYPDEYKDADIELCLWGAKISKELARQIPDPELAINHLVYAQTLIAYGIRMYRFVDGEDDPLYSIVKQREARLKYEKENKHRGFVYFIKVHHVTCDTLYKIGKSQNAETRIKTLGVNLPYLAETELLIETDNRHQLEWWIHQYLEEKGSRMRALPGTNSNEFFIVSDDDMEIFKSMSSVYIKCDDLETHLPY